MDLLIKNKTFVYFEFEVIQVLYANIFETWKLTPIFFLSTIRCFSQRYLKKYIFRKRYSRKDFFKKIKTKKIQEIFLNKMLKNLLKKNIFPNDK